MTAQSPRDKALNTILSLKRLAEHPNTPPAEAENAREKIKRLQDTHGIKPAETAAPKPPPRRPPPRQNPWQQEYPSQEDVLRHFQEAMRKAREEERRRAEASEAERRRKAQQDWIRKHYHSDDNGQPLTEEEKRRAREDPLGWASRQDKRSAQQKQDDLNGSWGEQARAAREAADAMRKMRDAAAKAKANAEPRCANPETYYDPGGEPRKRNQHIIGCDRCGRRLQPGEGMIMQVGGQWVGRCCEMVPGPRKRNPRHRD